MRPLDVLKAKGLLSWPELSYGLSNKWINESDVIEFAVAWLEKNSSETNKEIILMAGCAPSDQAELKDLLESYISESNVSIENVVDKWRLAFLIITKDESDESVRLKKLQDVYADFAFPSDMAKCSIYFTNEELQGGFVSSPLSEMEKVIQSLEKKFKRAEKVGPDL